MDSLSSRVLAGVENACRRRPVDCVLLSGGVDSSLLAACYRRSAITVTLRGVRHRDAHYSQIVAESLGIDWLLVEIDAVDALKELEQLMCLRNCFDRGLFNELAVFLALKLARSRGWRLVASGEGAELLFAGYDFLVQKGPFFKSYRASALQRTRFAETGLAKSLGVTMVYPYLSPEVIDIAERADLADCIHEAAPGHLITKTPLRRAAGQRLPGSIAWRERSDIEFGSGFATLGGPVVAASERFGWPREPCAFYWDDVHRALHRIFVGRGLVIPKPGGGQYACAWCGGGVDAHSRHCGTCGAYPANETPAKPSSDGAD